MKLRYEWIRHKERTFKGVVGVTIEEFEQIRDKVKPRWEQQEAKRDPRGQSRKLHRLEDQLLALLMYYRTYVTHEWLGCLFGLHNANICRLFKKLEPMVAKVIHIKKDRSLTPEKILKLLADVTEQPIQRPLAKKKNKSHYSGKKKRHTQKVELVMADTGQIISVSRSRPGSCHDITLRRSERPLPPHAQTWVDLGYQGLQKSTSTVHLPHKRQPKGSLTPQQKQANRQHAAFRIRIEHKIRELKIFRVLADVYRNFRKKHHLRFNIIAGIINLRHGF